MLICSFRFLKENKLKTANNAINQNPNAVLFINNDSLLYKSKIPQLFPSLSTQTFRKNITTPESSATKSK